MCYVILFNIIYNIYKYNITYYVIKFAFGDKTRFCRNFFFIKNFIFVDLCIYMYVYWIELFVLSKKSLCRIVDMIFNIDVEALNSVVYFIENFLL